MGSKAVDLTGVRLGRLVVIQKAKPRYDGKRTRWIVRCDCGTVKDVHQNSLRSGRTISCGCRGRETQQLFKMRYGVPKPKPEPTKRSAPRYVEPRPTDILYNRWTWIRWHAREKGIAFYPAWQNFEVFVSEVGRPPHEDYCLVRLDKRKGWLPGNVVWQEGRKKTCMGNRPYGLIKPDHYIQGGGE